MNRTCELSQVTRGYPVLYVKILFRPGDGRLTECPEYGIIKVLTEGVAGMEAPCAHRRQYDSAESGYVNNQRDFAMTISCGIVSLFCAIGNFIPYSTKMLRKDAQNGVGLFTKLA